MEIKDSGRRREFETGAVRDIQEGKGRCDLLPLAEVTELIQSGVLLNIWRFKETGNKAFLRMAIEVFAEENSFDLNTMALEVAKHFEAGAVKYGEYNWQKGIPVHCYIDSGIRHYLKWRRGDNDEPHDRAFVWNMLCCWWTIEHYPTLDDFTEHNDEKVRPESL
jgi:hypothetical protein